MRRHSGGQWVGCWPAGFMAMAPEGRRTCPGAGARASPVRRDPQRREVELVPEAFPAGGPGPINATRRQGIG